MESELYMIGLAGLLIFYATNKTADRQRQKRGEEGRARFFHLQLGFFTLYNMLIAYIVFASDVTRLQGIFYALAVGLHFLAVSHDLWREDWRRYERVGRFVLAGGHLGGDADERPEQGDAGRGGRASADFSSRRRRLRRAGHRV